MKEANEKFQQVLQAPPSQWPTSIKYTNRNSIYRLITCYSSSDLPSGGRKIQLQPIGGVELWLFTIACDGAAKSMVFKAEKRVASFVRREHRAIGSAKRIGLFSIWAGKAVSRRFSTCNIKLFQMYIQWFELGVLPSVSTTFWQLFSCLSMGVGRGINRECPSDRMFSD